MKSFFLMTLFLVITQLRLFACPVEIARAPQKYRASLYEIRLLNAIYRHENSQSTLPSNLRGNVNKIDFRLPCFKYPFQFCQLLAVCRSRKLIFRHQLCRSLEKKLNIFQSFRISPEPLSIIQCPQIWGLLIRRINLIYRNIF